MSYLYLALFLLAAASLAVPLLRRSRSKEVSKTDEKNVDLYEQIRPLDDFDWTKEPPLKLRPFKPKYHLTMSLQQTTLSDLVAVDSTYLDRIHHRRSLIASQQSSEIVAALPESTPLVHELYTWLFTTYMPRRFPTMFILQPPTPTSSHPTPYNQITNEPIPYPPLASPSECLSIIAAHIDNDFLLLTPLCPRPTKSTTTPSSHDHADRGADAGEEKYHLAALVNCFPSGFNPRSKLGLPLAAIHAPVPGYPAKLERSMDRFFARLPAGQIVKRANWTVTTRGDELFTLAGTHFHDHDHEDDPDGDDGDKAAAAAAAAEEEEQEGEAMGASGGKVERQRAELKIEDCRLRAERQTLHRLPVTGGLVFGVKTYMYGLDEVRAEEGMAEAMAEAILGLERGNVPDMKVYKRQVVWGDKVREYLLR